MKSQHSRSKFGAAVVLTWLCIACGFAAGYPGNAAALTALVLAGAVLAPSACRELEDPCQGPCSARRFMESLCPVGRSASHLASIVVFATLVTVGAPTHAQADGRQAIEQLDEFSSHLADRNYSGRLDEGIEALISHPAAKGGRGMSHAGTLIRQITPDLALRLQERAATLLPEDLDIQYELALQYTATEDCRRAVPIWKKLRKEAHIPDAAAYVAAFCFLATKDYAMAMDIVVDSDVLFQQEPAHKMSHYVFGGPATLLLFDREYRAAAAGQRGALEAALLRAFDWEADWRRRGPNPHAIAAMRKLMHGLWDEEKRERVEWDCLWTALVSTKPLRSADAETCRTLVGDQPLPASSALALTTLRRLGDGQWTRLLARHGGELLRRANSPAGDLQAVRAVALLQSKAHDKTGLAATNRLGWSRYHEAAFAVDALVGQKIDSAQFRAEFKRALEAFPDEPYLLIRKAMIDHPDGRFSANDVAELIRAETKSLEMTTRLGKAAPMGALPMLYRQLSNALQPELDMLW